MAENRRTVPQQPYSAQGAVLRQGRAADPLPASGPAPQPTPAPDAPAPTPSQGAPTTDPAPEKASDPKTPPETPETDDKGRAEMPETGNADAEDAPEVQSEQARAQVQQQELRLLLRQCDRVLLMDFDRLAMSDWPDNYTLAAARRGRDLWLFSAFAAALVFISGLTGLVPAWVAGTGFGAFVVIVLMGIPAARRLYTSSPSYLDVVIKRQRMLSEARAHAAHLEGKEGLIWQCARMARFNAALRHPRFNGLLRLSERRILPKHLTRREHVRLYLIYLLEAEKAYGRVQTAFFEGNQRAIDRGWQEAVAEPENRS